MDKQGRLTKWEEWEVGASYQWTKGDTTLPPEVCAEVNRREGYIRFDRVSGDVVRFYSWQKRFKKVATPDENLVKEVDRLRTAIRKHRDQRGDDRCWLDDQELYSVLPEGYTPPKEDSCVELEHCRKFIASRHDPSIAYSSPQRRIEQLEARIAQLEIDKLPIGNDP